MKTRALCCRGILGLAVVLAACADVVDERDLDSTGSAWGEEEALAPEPFTDGVEKIRNGTVTSERPEVGSIGGCTATLIAADLAITAAHCVGYRTASQRGRYMTFRLDAAGGAHRVTVDRYRSFSNQLGAGDVALLGLAEAVPERVAQPAPIASRNPANGTSVTVFGYGCTAIGQGSDGRKRKATFRFGQASAHLCPGDSGGPVFDDSTGAIFGINSGYRLDAQRTDIYGNVPTVYAALKAQADEWTRFGLPGEGPPREPPPDRGDGGAELMTCGETLACRRSECNLQGEQCLQGCLDRSAADAVRLWRAVYDCANAAGCRDFACTQGRCAAELAACDAHGGAEPEPEEPERPERPEPGPVRPPNAPRCGEEMQVFARWTCTTNGQHRHQCPAGGAPVWETCAFGCWSPGPGADAECHAREPRAGELLPHADHGACNEVYRPYVAWTCASDDRTLLRCEAGRLQTHRCANGCQAAPRGAHTCR